MESTPLQKSFIIIHWLSTLLLAPFIAELFQMAILKDPHRVVAPLEIYPLTFFISLILSLPTLIIYLATFHLIKSKEISSVKSKFILTSVAVLGIFLTMFLLGSNVINQLSVSYTLVVIVVGFSIKIRQKSL